MLKDNMQADIDSLEKEVKERDERIEELEEESKKVAADLLKASAVEERIKEEKENYIFKESQLRKNIELITAKVEKQTEDLLTAKETEDELISIQTQLEQNLVDMGVECSKKDEELESVQQKMKEVEEKRLELTDTVQVMETELQRLTESESMEREERERLETEMKQLKEEKQKLLTTIEEDKIKFAELKKDEQETAATFMELDAMIEQLTEENEGLKLDKDQLESALKEQGTADAITQVSLQRMEADVERYKKQIEIAKHRQLEAQRSADETTEKNVRLQAELSTMSLRVDTMTGQHSRLESRIKRVEQQRIQAEKRADGIISRGHSFEAELEKLRKELLDSKQVALTAHVNAKQESKLNATVEALKKKFDEEKTELRKKIHSFTRDNASLSMKAKNSESLLLSANSKMEELMEALQHKREEVTRIRTRNIELEKELTAADATMRERLRTQAIKLNEVVTRRKGARVPLALRHRKKSAAERFLEEKIPFSELFGKLKKTTQRQFIDSLEIHVGSEIRPGKESERLKAECRKIERLEKMVKTQGTQVKTTEREPLDALDALISTFKSKTLE
eukprot:gnl/Carplike_NY0171/3906_a5268_274.p1 GENE.gnl/Carplike_NY0171/3906_a5268_274~~gnl/Carplike_NY0171/3906_a5268_274.p1  ORF type:complete len:571 (+),score=198.81 gnl/Carplike_NY0171/3906_a5268_274:1143-2855(+)